jgi:MoxR-like ATPase
MPEDIQAVLPAVISHRLYPAEEHLDLPSTDLVERLIAAVGVPC